MNAPDYYLGTQIMHRDSLQRYCNEFLIYDGNRTFLKKILQQGNLMFKDKLIEFKTSLFYIPKKFYFFLKKRNEMQIIIE